MCLWPCHLHANIGLLTVREECAVSMDYGGSSMCLMSLKKNPKWALWHGLEDDKVGGRFVLFYCRSYVAGGWLARGLSLIVVLVLLPPAA